MYILICVSKFDVFTYLYPPSMFVYPKLEGKKDEVHIFVYTGVSVYTLLSYIWRFLYTCYDFIYSYIHLCLPILN
jgi:hypothetical protein